MRDRAAVIDVTAPTTRRLAGWALACCLVAITYGSLDPRTAPPGAYDFDKLVHIGAYGLSGLLACIAFLRRANIVLMELAISALGGLIEIAQWLSGTREGSWADFAADAAGVLLGCILGLWLKRRAMRRSLLHRPLA